MPGPSLIEFSEPEYEPEALEDPSPSDPPLEYDKVPPGAGAGGALCLDLPLAG